MIRRPAMNRCGRKGFTLIELLVVVVIILLLLSLLLPSMGRALAIAEMTLCSTKLRQIAMGFRTFATDNQQYTPGCYRANWIGVEPWKWSWMGAEAWKAGDVPPTYLGTLLPYMSLNVQTVNDYTNYYRCPSLDQGVWGSGFGSNGLFDYGSFLVFAGAKINLIPGRSTLASKFKLGTVPTPMIVEESPRVWQNYCCIEPGHSNTDRMGNWHLDGSFMYGAYDASVQRLFPPPLGATDGIDEDLDGTVDEADEAGMFIGPNTWEWSGLTPKGVSTTYSSDASGWGGWNNR